MDLGDLERVSRGQRWQEPGHPGGQHGLAGASWPDHQQVMAASRSDFEGLAPKCLAPDIRQVGGRWLLGRVGCRRELRPLCLVPEDLDEDLQTGDCSYGRPLREAGFLRARRSHHNRGIGH